MEITLLMKEKDNKMLEKTFKPKFISTRTLKEAAKLLSIFEDEENQSLSLAKLYTEDKIENFIVELYENQFTVDELLDGYPANQFFNKFIEDVTSIVNGLYDLTKN